MKIFRLLIIFFVFCIAGCLNNKKIEITTEYIINENWHKEWSSSIGIDKMKVKRDSIINPFSDLSQAEILSKLENDSSFSWFASANNSKNKEEIYKTKKIYFGRDNGFFWRSNVTGEEINNLGNLEINTWYMFSGLVGYPYFVYVYIDSTNFAHRFNVNLANW